MLKNEWCQTNCFFPLARFCSCWLCVAYAYYLIPWRFSAYAYNIHKFWRERKNTWFFSRRLSLPLVRRRRILSSDNMTKYVSMSFFCHSREISANTECRRNTTRAIIQWSQYLCDLCINWFTIQWCLGRFQFIQVRIQQGIFIYYHFYYTQHSSGSRLAWILHRRKVTIGTRVHHDINANSIYIVMPSTPGRRCRSDFRVKCLD